MSRTSVRRKGIRARGERIKSCRTRKGKVLSVHGRKASREVEVELHLVLISALDLQGQTRATAALAPGKTPELI